MHLPVHPLQLDQSNFVPIQQFGQHAPFPPVQPPPRTAMVLQAVLSHFTINVQQQAGRHVPRIFFTNLISRNRWMNEECAKTLAVVFDIVEYRLNTTAGDPMAVALAAVDEAIPTMVAYWCNAYIQGLSQYLQPDAFQGIQSALQLLGQFQNAIAQYNQTYAQPQQYNYGQNVQFQGTYPAATGVGFGTPGVQPMVAATSPMSGFDTPLRTGARTINAPSNTALPVTVDSPYPSGDYRDRPRMGVIRPAPIEPERPQVQQNGWQPMTSTRVDEISGGPGVATIVKIEETPKVERATTIVTDNGTAVTDLEAVMAKQYGRPTAQALFPPPPPPSPPVQSEEPDHQIVYPEDPYREIKFRDGTVVRRATESGWTRVRTGKRPYPFAFDPTHQMLMHTRTPDGVVHEIVQEDALRKSSEPMETYEQHELNPELRQRERERRANEGGKHVVDWSLVTDLTPEPQMPYALETVPSTEVTDLNPTPEREGEAQVAEETSEEPTETDREVNDSPVKTYDGVMVCADPKSALAQLVADHENLREIVLEHPIEIYAERHDSRLTVKDLYGIFRDFSHCTTYSEMHAALAAARQQAPADKEIWDEVDSRLTRQVNRLLNIGLAVDWKIGSFSEDVLGIAVELENDFGRETAEAFENAAMSVIDLATEINGIENLKDQSGHTIEFVTRYSVTSVPYDFEDLSVSYNGYGAVTKQILPKLHEFIDGVFARTPGIPSPFAYRYLKTRDNVWVCMDDALLANDTYLLSDFPKQ